MYKLDSFQLVYDNQGYYKVTGKGWWIALYKSKRSYAYYGNNLIGFNSRNDSFIDIASKGACVMVKVSGHGNTRVRDRCGIPKKSVERLAEKAYLYGISHNETTGSLNKYITAQYFKKQTANNIRVYNNNVFIFSGSTLITVLNLPRRFLKIANKIMKRKQENICEGEVS
jgi:hypothetical protein